MESFNDWFSLYHHNQPSKPTLIQGATFTEKVAHEHRMKKYQQEIDRWQSNLILQTKVGMANYCQYKLYKSNLP